MRIKQVARKSTGGVAPRPIQWPPSPTRLSEDHFSAWVKVDGQELRIYDKGKTVEGNKTVISGYIPSEAGNLKVFSVHWCDRGRTYTSLGKVCIDGMKIGQEYIDPFPQGGNTREVAFLESSSGYQQTLVFSQIETTDNHEYLDKLPPAGLGEICVEICKANPTKKTKMLRDKWRKTEKSRVREAGCGLGNFGGPVHETIAKAGTHRFQLGEKVRKRKAEESDSGSEYEDKPTYITLQHFNFDPPHLIFKFLYRPRERLQADGIVPQGASESRGGTNSQALAAQLEAAFLQQFHASQSFWSSPFGHPGYIAQPRATPMNGRPQPPSTSAFSKFCQTLREELREKTPAACQVERRSPARQRSLSVASAVTELEYADDPLWGAAEPLASASAQTPAVAGSSGSSNMGPSEPDPSPQSNQAGPDAGTRKGSPAHPDTITSEDAPEEPVTASEDVLRPIKQEIKMEVKQEIRQGDSLSERIDRLQAELTAARQELERINNAVKPEPKTQRLIKLKEEVREDGIIVYDLTDD